MLTGIRNLSAAPDQPEELVLEHRHVQQDDARRLVQMRSVTYDSDVARPFPNGISMGVSFLLRQDKRDLTRQASAGYPFVGRFPGSHHVAPRSGTV